MLARILDDPTFSVLNSLIFFHQVDIVNHLQSNQKFLHDLFAIFGPDEQDHNRKKEAVLFIQNCCAVSKNIQAQSRAHLYSNFIQHGLFGVITFALKHHDASVRVAGTDILVALIDHDPHMVRNHIFTAIKEKAVPLTDTLIELLLVEVDLGVKSQMADAIKILLDPGSNQAAMEMMNRAQNPEMVAKQRGQQGGPNGQRMNGIPAQTDQFIKAFYEDSAKRLFQPLKDLEYRTSMVGMSVQETSLYTHLVEVLCFFVRQHNHDSKLFILSEHMHPRVAQLLACPQKYMKLTALKWFRTCIGLQDEFHNRQLIQHRLFEPILNIVYETMPRDNLLNSACLELFEHIKREAVKQLITHLVEQYRDRLMGITYVNTFQALVLKYDQMQAGYPVNGTEDSFTTQEGTPHRMVNGGQRNPGLRDLDEDEQSYFEGGDDEEDEEGGLPSMATAKPMMNGASPVRPLVNYPDDDEDAMDILASSPDPLKDKKSSSSSDLNTTDTEPTLDTMDEDFVESERGRDRRPRPVEESPTRNSPPESIAMKRRRQDEDDDELGKMMGVKRRNSSASISGKTHKLKLGGMDGSNDENGLHAVKHEDDQVPAHGHSLRRKGSLKTKNEVSGVGRFAIKPVNLAAVKNEHEQENGNGPGHGDGG